MRPACRFSSRAERIDVQCISREIFFVFLCIFTHYCIRFLTRFMYRVMILVVSSKWTRFSPFEFLVLLLQLLSDISTGEIHDDIKSRKNTLNALTFSRGRFAVAEWLTHLSATLEVTGSRPTFDGYSDIHRPISPFSLGHGGTWYYLAALKEYCDHMWYRRS